MIRHPTIGSMTSHLPALVIGPITCDVPVMQAALSGYSDAPMRMIARRFGAPYTLCGVALDQFVLQLKKRQRNRHHLFIADEEHPVGGQLMGANPIDFGSAARQLVERGFDGIEINFGCPVKKVLGRYRGGYHLHQPAIALEIVARVRDAVPESVPVTVKMRRGIDDSSGNRDKFFQIFDGAYMRGVAAITVHSRTVQQRYDGNADWDFLRKLKQHAGNRILIGSGDLLSAQTCVDRIRTTGVDGVAVARGAIGNPWIFQQIRALAAGQPLPDPPSLDEQRYVIAEHYRMAESLYGPRRCLPGMRKFAIQYSKLHPAHELVRDAFVQVKEPEGWAAVLNQWYS
ncbi:MAG: tRNA-dihydrouridine synthase [Pirellulales bacterium]|nr:tRNA-dihydrouridine synthase [Pirellulales bacterium]